MEIILKLYLLELADHKYYVGQSDDPEFRFLEHLGSKGAKWTRLHKPVRIKKIESLTVQTVAETMLYENWMTLQAMERYGWENVRGGEFLVVENYLLKDRLKYIYDFEANKIRYYVNDKRHYLFGQDGSWLVYALELTNHHYYVGSCKNLGKSLGEHFNGTGISWTRNNPVNGVVELIVVKPEFEDYLEVKNRLLMTYIDKYGWSNVLGGQMPARV
ncbi:MAG: GIY-YIG nuclease family protein [Bacteroidetes bacterium]|nr:GIY-YIG nuclease family protein [Bacteroidota bacterium]